MTIELHDAAVRARRQAEGLALSTALLDATFEASPAGIMAVDRSGYITAFNRKTVSLWELATATQSSRAFSEWTCAFAEQVSEPREVVALLRTLVYTDADVPRVGDFTMRDGRTIEYAAAPQMQSDVRTGVVITFSDVTDRARATREQERFTEQLRQAQKMESIGALAGGIAHDFNNILGAILGNVALASASIYPAHPAAESLDSIRVASERATRLVQRILTFSRGHRQEIKSLSLGLLLTETAGLLRASIPAGIDIDLAIDDDVENIEGDATQLHQVIMNLGTNAWHAVRERCPASVGTGRLTLGLRSQRFGPVSEEVRPPGLPNGSYSVVTIADDGIGISESVQARMFEP